MRFGWLALVLALVPFTFAANAGGANAAADASLPSAELARIERLLELVGQASDRRFIRNGTAYDASTAARFLRLKWQSARQRVHTAEDFVREIGSRSGTTGSRYRVRGADGTEEDSADFLTRLLTDGS